jgi:hypothetical protein
VSRSRIVRSASWPCRTGCADPDGVTSLTRRLDDALVPRLDAVRRGLEAPARTTRSAVVIGRLLGLDVTVVFLTGVWSHLLQEPPDWLPLPTRPVTLYQWTQGLHVVLGTVLIPLVLAKLWVVYPRLFEWPPVTSVAHAAERLSVALLVSTSLLQPLIGLVNTYQWYPWPFPFRQTHWVLAWVMVGSVLLHVAVKLPLVVEHWRRGGRRA